MKIYHQKLWLVAPGWSMQKCFEYSKDAELAVANLLALPNPVLTEGYFPGYDFEVDSVRYEVKFQNTNELRIEHHQSRSGKPSGIMTTTADKWIVVSTGMTMQGELVGKIRMYDPSDLRESVLATKHEGTYLTISPKQVDHEWLGDVVWNDREKYWDLSKWKRKAWSTTR